MSRDEKVTLSLQDDFTPAMARAKAATAELAREIALTRVERAADPVWMAEARDAIETLAATVVEFTSDDVWELLERRGVRPPREKRALGVVTRAALRDLDIIGTGRYVNSRRKSRHAAPIQVYRAAS